MPKVMCSLGVIVGLSLLLSACCTTPSGIKFSDGVSKKLAEMGDDSVAVIFGPRGDSILVDREGRVATECAIPINVARQKGMLGKDTPEQEHSQTKADENYSEGHSGLPKCAGLDKGFIVEGVGTKTILYGGPNPHGCSYCYTEITSSGTAREICSPLGCERRGHPR